MSDKKRKKLIRFSWWRSAHVRWWKGRVLWHSRGSVASYTTTSGYYGSLTRLTRVSSWSTLKLRDDATGDEAEFSIDNPTTAITEIRQGEEIIAGEVMPGKRPRRGKRRLFFMRTLGYGDMRGISASVPNATARLVPIPWVGFLLAIVSLIALFTLDVLSGGNPWRIGGPMVSALWLFPLAMVGMQVLSVPWLLLRRIMVAWRFAQLSRQATKRSFWIKLPDLFTPLLLIPILMVAPLALGLFLTSYIGGGEMPKAGSRLAHTTVLRWGHEMLGGWNYRIDPHLADFGSEESPEILPAAGSPPRYAMLVLQDAEANINLDSLLYESLVRNATSNLRRLRYIHLGGPGGVEEPSATKGAELVKDLPEDAKLPVVLWLDPWGYPLFTPHAISPEPPVRKKRDVPLVIGAARASEAMAQSDATEAPAEKAQALDAALIWYALGVDGDMAMLTNRSGDALKDVDEQRRQKLRRTAVIHQPQWGEALARQVVNLDADAAAGLRDDYKTLLTDRDFRRFLSSLDARELTPFGERASNEVVAGSLQLIVAYLRDNPSLPVESQQRLLLEQAKRHNMLGQRSEAKAVLRRLIALDPPGRWAQVARRWLAKWSG